MKYSVLIVSLMILSGMTVHAQDHIHYLYDQGKVEREHSVDITKMVVRVSFVPDSGKVSGTVNHAFTCLQNGIDTLFFDGPDIHIESAKMDGQPVRFVTHKHGVTIHFERTLNWDEKHEIEFRYHAYPQKGIYFWGWNQPKNTGIADINYIRKQIWTQGQGIDNRYWIPMYDNMNDKFITETITTFASTFRVLSNGKLVSEKVNSDGTTTWHYALNQPHAGYLLMLAIGHYNIKSTKTIRNTPVHFWYYPEFTERLEPTSLHTEKMVELLEDETGVPYPWGSYSQVMVQNFLYGAMENTSATVFGDFFSVDQMGFKDRNYLGVNCHELTHQWFGDLITARAGNDIWLQESFATFYPKLFFKQLEGEDTYSWMFRDECNRSLTQGQKDDYPVRHTKGGSVRNYPKGSAVLSMLRYQIGDESFKRMIKHYLTTHAYRNVETWDFQKAIKDKLGLNYDWFFDQWIHRGGEPHFKVQYSSATNNIIFTVEQIHKTDGHIRYFRAPLRLSVYFSNGEFIDRDVVVGDSVTQQFSIPNPGNKTVRFVLFDKGSRVMKKLTFQKSFEELSAQLMSAPDMIDRFDALHGLDSFEYPQKKYLLQGVLQKEKFHGMRAEAYRQMANQPEIDFDINGFLNESKSSTKLAFLNEDTLVKSHLTIFKSALSDSSYAVVEKALDKIMKSAQVEIPVKIELLSETNSIIGQNYSIRVKWLEYASGYDMVNRPEFVEKLAALAGPAYEFRTRVNAAQALQRINAFDDRICDALFDAVCTYNQRLAGPCSEVLIELGKNAEYRSIIVNKSQILPEKQKSLLKKYKVID